MIWLADCERASTGLRLISIRPLLSVMLVPSTPMKEDRLTMSGSLSSAWAMASWRRAISAYDTDCGASVMAWMRPVSCTGKNPLGMNTYSAMVTTRVATATASVSGWRSSTHLSATP